MHVNAEEVKTKRERVREWTQDIPANNPGTCTSSFRPLTTRDLTHHIWTGFDPSFESKSFRTERNTTSGSQNLGETVTTRIPDFNLFVRYWRHLFPVMNIEVKSENLHIHQNYLEALYRGTADTNILARLRQQMEKVSWSKRFENRSSISSITKWISRGFPCPS